MIVFSPPYPLEGHFCGFNAGLSGYFAQAKLSLRPDQSTLKAMAPISRNKTNFDQIALEILQHFGLDGAEQSKKDLFVEKTSPFLLEHMGEAIEPRDRDTLALSLTMPKTAALSFDRVYKIPFRKDPVPDEIGFFGATDRELSFWSMIGFVAALDERKEFDTKQALDRYVQNTDIVYAEDPLKYVISELSQLFGVIPTIFTEGTYEPHEKGAVTANEVLHTAIDELALVDESKLSWEQVLEFRNDEEAKIKYRRFMNWANDLLKSDSTSELQDRIALRLNDYEWSIKKHGIVSVNGAISAVLDPKFIVGVSAAATVAGMAGGPLWAVLAGIGLPVGKATVRLRTTAIEGADERRQNSGEIAYLYDLKRKLRRG